MGERTLDYGAGKLKRPGFFESGRLIPVLLVAIAGILISVCAFFISYRFEEQKRNHLFLEQALPFTQHLPELLEERIQELDSVVRFYNGSDFVTRAEFDSFVYPVIRARKDIAGIVWIPRVNRAERPEFERQVRASGLPNFKIHERTADGSNAEVGASPFCYPYLYICPMSGNAGLIGFDAWTDPLRRSLIELAMDKGGPAISGNVAIAVESLYGASRGLIAVAPVYKSGMPAFTPEQRREAISGFLAMALRPVELIKDLGEKGLYKRIEAKLLDSTSDAHLGELASNPDVIVKKRTIAGREFTVLCKPKKSFYDANPLVVPWLYLALGLLATAASVGLFAYREMQLAFLNKAIRRGFDVPELRTASSIRVRIVLAAALAMALMLAWFLLWTHRELSSVGEAASRQAALQATKIWLNLISYDMEDLKDACNSSLSDAAVAGVWSSSDRWKTKRAIKDFAARVKLDSPGDSIILAGVDRRCIVRSDEIDGYGELVDARMLAETLRTGKVYCGVDMDSNGALKLRLCSPYAPGAGSSAASGFIILTKDISFYPDSIRRIAGCELFLALYKSGLDEKLWRNAAAKSGKAESASWDDYPDFIPEYLGSISRRLVYDVSSAILAASWDDIVSVGAGSESWSCATVPVEDYSGRDLGRMVVLRDVSQALAAQRKTMAMTLAGAGALAILLVLAISSFAGAMERRLLSSILARENEEAELHALKERLASTLHSIGDAVISTDVEGKVIDMNSVAESLTGWKLSEARGRRIEAIFNLINATTKRKAEIPVDKVLKEGRVVGMANHSALISRNGGETQISDSAAPIRSASGEVIGAVLVFRDVGEDYKVREELRKSEERFRLLAENAKDAIFVMRAPSANFDYISPAINDISGYSPEDFYVDGFLPRIVFKEDMRIFSDALASAFSGHPPVSAEFRIVRKDGRPVWISARSSVVRDASGNVVAIQGLATDISSRKTIEEALRKSEELYRTLVDNIDVGIVLLNLDRRIVMANKCFASRFGKDVSYFIGRKCYETIEGKGFICPHCPGTKAMETAIPAEAEFDFAMPDGRVCRMHNRALPVKDKDGAISGFIEITVDATEARLAEERKLHLEQQLLQAQKMESVGRLAGGIAHDFNNMLTPIIGYADILLKKSVQDEKTRSRLEQILKAANKARDLTRQLLAMGRKQTMQMRHLSLNEVVGGFERILRRTVREDIAFELRLSPSIGAVFADPGQIEQIILNLAVNSQDAMPSGGRLKISTFEKMVDDEFAQRHDGAQIGSYVCLSVADNGAGMDDSVLNKIFEPFFTTKPQGKGTGLGLSTVYGIVKQHGGFIDVASELGKGSVFSVYLPRSGATPTALALDASLASEAAPPLGAEGSECILVAEDEENVLNMVAEMLRSKGYEVLAASDGLRGLELASSRLGRIDLLLTDVVMPGLNGKALYERVRGVRKNIKVLFMSGYTNNLIGGDLQLGPASDYIQKPFTLDSLAEKVRSVLDAPKP